MEKHAITHESMGQWRRRSGNGQSRGAAGGGEADAAARDQAQCVRAQVGHGRASRGMAGAGGQQRSPVRGCHAGVRRGVAATPNFFYLGWHGLEVFGVLEGLKDKIEKRAK